jgi:hypothetical protein
MGWWTQSRRDGGSSNCSRHCPGEVVGGGYGSAGCLEVAMDQHCRRLGAAGVLNVGDVPVVGGRDLLSTRICGAGCGCFRRKERWGVP